VAGLVALVQVVAVTVVVGTAQMQTVKLVGRDRLTPEAVVGAAAHLELLGQTEATVAPVS
jgi:hypothetical protein